LVGGWSEEEDETATRGEHEQNRISIFTISSQPRVQWIKKFQSYYSVLLVVLAGESSVLGD